MIAESGNVLGHSQRSVIKVTVQRAACLAQLPGLSADLDTNQFHRDIQLGGTVHRSVGKTGQSLDLKNSLGDEMKLTVTR